MIQPLLNLFIYIKFNFKWIEQALNDALSRVEFKFEQTDESKFF